jgi:HK97 family phage prohead protease
MKFKDFKAEISPNIDKYEFEAYAAIKNVWDDARENIKDGAFTKTLQERFPKNLIKVFWWHREPMGLPIQVREDSKGLYTWSRVSRTETNKERMILMADRVVDKMSIGYNVVKYNPTDEGNELLELKLYEYSPCPIAMNEETFMVSVKSMQDLFNFMDYAKAMSLKTVTKFADLPLADRMRTWDADAATGRLRKWAGGPDKDEIDWGKYQKAFFWFDSGDKENFKAYKLGFADIIDGTLTAIPKGVFAAAAAIQGARGGVILPEADVPGVKSHIEKYYAKMKEEFEDEDIAAPWAKEMSELLLKEGRVLSAANRKKIVDAVGVLQDLLEMSEAEKSFDEQAFKDMLTQMKDYRISFLG